MIRLHPSIFRFVLGIISLVLSLGLIRSLYTQISKKDAVAERQDKILSEQARNAELKRELEEATSSAFVEKLAREKLGMVKEGDTVILIDTSHSTNPNNQKSNSTLTSNWESWLNLFR